jgi:hypothetical protein
MSKIKKNHVTLSELHSEHNTHMLYKYSNGSHNFQRKIINYLAQNYDKVQNIFLCVVSFKNKRPQLGESRILMWHSLVQFVVTCSYSECTAWRLLSWYWHIHTFTFFTSSTVHKHTYSATLHPAVQYLPHQPLTPYALKAEWFMGIGHYHRLNL